jgi:hypothetical protein
MHAWKGKEMRELYTLDVEEIDDDPKFNSTGKAYRAYIYAHGEEIGDGLALTKEQAIIEALRESEIIE